ncbi:MAG: peptidase, partial [Planctomycetota bacterium]
PLHIIQGITEVTPNYTRVQSLSTAQGVQYAWDMRLATSSIPRQTLADVLAKHLDSEDSDLRLKIVTLYLQSKRYREAEEELREAIKEFPELVELKKQLKELRQLRSKQQLDELKLRKNAGQHALVQNLIKAFPNQDVAGEILLEVSELSDAYRQQEKAGERIFENLTAQSSSLKSEQHKKIFAAFMEELKIELGYNSLPRLADYLRLLNDEELGDEQKLALGMSGWLLNGNGVENLSVATSLWKVRDLARQYLRSDDPATRRLIISELASQEGGSPKYVARLVAALHPPVRTTGLKDRHESSTDPSIVPQHADALPATGKSLEIPGLFEIEVAGIRPEKPFKYLVQLPPSYDAHRRYPVIVSLHAAGSTPRMQIDWWAGGFNNRVQQRLGQASRHGYIVIAPAWANYRQNKYGYTATEHAAVLYSLRDAFQRFSINTDRVFLTGHSMGGDAAWDIGLAHPDLWAGILPISALSVYKDKNSPNYVSHYFENAQQVPMYFVRGSLDAQNIDLNSRDQNKYFKHTGFDTMLVEYRGRGHEHCPDEIQRMFTWMDLHRRDFAKSEFVVDTMRPWDNFFWWLEVDGIPSRAVMLPSEWGIKKFRRPSTIECSVREKSNVLVSTGTEKATIYLSPDLVDLESRFTVRVNNTKLKTSEVSASAEVILEDARTRGDRRHPFWVKIETKTGRSKR